MPVSDCCRWQVNNFLVRLASATHGLLKTDTQRSSSKKVSLNCSIYDVEQLLQFRRSVAGAARDLKLDCVAELELSDLSFTGTFGTEGFSGRQGVDVKQLTRSLQEVPSSQPWSPPLGFEGLVLTRSLLRFLVPVIMEDVESQRRDLDVLWSAVQEALETLPVLPVLAFLPWFCAKAKEIVTRLAEAPESYKAVPYMLAHCKHIGDSQMKKFNTADPSSSRADKCVELDRLIKAHPGQHYAAITLPHYLRSSPPHNLTLQDWRAEWNVCLNSIALVVGRNARRSVFYKKELLRCSAHLLNTLRPAVTLEDAVPFVAMEMVRELRLRKERRRAWADACDTDKRVDKLVASLPSGTKLEVRNGADNDDPWQAVVAYQTASKTNLHTCSDLGKGRVRLLPYEHKTTTRFRRRYRGRDPDASANVKRRRLDEPGCFARRQHVHDLFARCHHDLTSQRLRRKLRFLSQEPITLAWRLVLLRQEPVGLSATPGHRRFAKSLFVTAWENYGNVGAHVDPRIGQWSDKVFKLWSPEALTPPPKWPVSAEHLALPGKKCSKPGCDGVLDSQEILERAADEAATEVFICSKCRTQTYKS